MKILFISANSETYPYPVTPLGIAYLIQAVKERGHQSATCDLCFEDNKPAALTQIVADFKPDFIAVSIRNIDNTSYLNPFFYLEDIKELLRLVKQKTPAPMILGGSGFSLFPEEILRFLELNFGIKGEGENALPQWIDAIHNRTGFQGIKNLCYLYEKRFIQNPLERIDKISTPDRSGLQNRRYFELGGMANLETKRGCPFTCDYCSYPLIHGKKARLREPTEIIEELYQLQTREGIDHVFFTDDIFNHPLEHALEICEGMIRRELKINWFCFATPRAVSFDEASLMKKAGCMGVEFGSDAGSELTLKGHGKSFGLEDIKTTILNCQKAKLPQAHYLILGGPEESLDSLKETVEFYKTHRPNAVIASVGVRIFAETTLRLRAIKEGIITPEQNLLRPAFYLSPAINKNQFIHQLRQLIVKETNWIVPDLKIGPEKKTLEFLREKGIKGPLWNLLS
ncbi:MAG: cobalamin-dependent protein [Deltaproteobacteria bacterium]|nr:cobalamin-dependent protein [Deltaproteobacteria bacterium]